MPILSGLLGMCDEIALKTFLVAIEEHRKGKKSTLFHMRSTKLTIPASTFVSRLHASSLDNVNGTAVTVEKYAISI